MKRSFLALLTSLALPYTSHSQSKQFPEFTQIQNKWVDSVYQSLTPDERIGQLIMVAATSDVKRSIIDPKTSNPAYVENLIKTYKVGGVVFFQGGPVPQALLTNKYQAMSKVPLLIAMDAEFGLAMRIDSTVRYPYQMTLGAINGHNDLIKEMGAQIGEQARRLGMHINFAPVVDVNNNASNPVINFRSFGENKYKVTEKALAYMQGMQGAKILTSAKHFPGHGDTGVDSHYSTPLINHSRERLDTLELYPFKKLIENGLNGMMVAHLSIPALDNTPNLPSTLSKPIINDLLRKELGFTGLIYSDAMNMKGVTTNFPNGEADAKGLEAGLDILEFSENVPKAIEAIKQAVAEGRISQAEIDERCKKVLKAKYWVGLNHYTPISLDNLYEDLNPAKAELTNRLLTEKALTVLKNTDNILPLKNLDQLNIAVVSIGGSTPTTFQKIAGLYTNTTNFQISDNATDEEINALVEKLNGFTTILTGVHLSTIRPGANYGVTPSVSKTVKRLNETNKNIVTLFGNPYSINKFESLEGAKALVLSYQLTEYTEDLSAQLAFGAIPALGKLPVTVNTTYPYNSGIETPTLGRLKYTIPEEVGLDSKVIIPKIDSLMNLAITRQATPGGVVQLAKDGKVFFRKAYGNHTYEGTEKVKIDDLYDLASVTKITAATLSLMGLYDQGTFDLDATVADYLPRYKKSNIGHMKWHDILTHKAGLKAFSLLWKEAQNEDGTWKKKSFSTKPSKKYPTVIVPNKLYIHKKYSNVVYDAIGSAPVNEKQGYVYSDMSFMLYPLIVKDQTNVPFEQYLKENYYNKLGANSLTLNPTRFYDLTQIAPTEIDTFFRKTLVHGFVHDESAAMLGGVSGHAGLFGNANDVMKVWQMFLQKGYYGGQQLVTKPTIEKFTAYQFPEIQNRRGIGFDKPSFKYTGNAPKYASPSSFGHTGFTGIMTWADPAWGLNFVFLSNRVYPYRSHGALGTLNIRTGIMDTIYQELIK